MSVHVPNMIFEQIKEFQNTPAYLRQKKNMAQTF